MIPESNNLWYRNTETMTLFLVLFQLLSILWLTVPSCSNEEIKPIALPGCEDHCGQVRIPYPFGIGPNCFKDEWYQISCPNNSKPFLQKFNLEVMNIDWGYKYSPQDPRSKPDEVGEGNKQLTVLMPLVNMCANDEVRGKTRAVQSSINFEGSPYTFVTSQNVVVKGCGGSVLVKQKNETILGGCASVCANDSSSVNIDETADCYGVGCCQAMLDDVGRIASFDLVLDDADGVLDSRQCNMVAGLIESDTTSVDKFAGTQRVPNLTSPVTLAWTTKSQLGNKILELDNVTCPTGEYCYCNLLHEGNPYMPNGCQVVKECLKCTFVCARRHDGSCYRYHCENPWLKPGPILGFSISTGLGLVLMGCYWLYGELIRKQEVRRRVEYFQRNGGLLLRQRLSSSEGIFESAKIFSISELEKATDKFNRNRILGRGGQGTVYKGMLFDGRIVAIKKSKQVDKSQLEQFINEVVILSQINHRNVVKLLGCCLETQVPLLVYEFIPNGTLYQHIHNPTHDFHVDWKMRLQIAAESANAIAYLHSSSSTPIYHRDIKSSNILLDHKFRAKVSDFGTSRAIAIEQTHVTTCVLGTYGYLDPEYFQSNQFTEKSDVYSFGVVLVELLTGKKPTCPTKSGGWISLAYEFLSHMETSQLFDFLDKRVLEEGTEDEFIAVANLARQCLHIKGKHRPTMKEIAVLLDRIRSHHVPNSKGLDYVESKRVVTEKSSMDGASATTSMCFSDIEACSSWLFEEQTLMTETL